MNEELKIVIGADVGNFTGGVLNVMKSIGELETELKQFQKDIKTLKGDEFTVMADKIATLKANISALKSAGSSTLPKLGEDAAKAAHGVDELAKPAGNAAYTLTNLGGVVRDLPFGFIAIQNNLPLVVDSFSNLAKTSGGVGGALKGLGAAMIGPAGIGFAFGAVTSLVTGLIQEYGSLGGAITALTSKNKAAAESQILFNQEISKGQDSTGAEVAQIDILVKQLTNLQNPLATRQAAYEQLKKVQPDILQGITKENALTGTATSLIIANATARKDMIMLKVKENAINEVLNKNGGELLRLENKRNLAINEQAASQNKLDELKKNSPNQLDTIRREEVRLTQLKNATLAAREEFDKLQSVQNSYINLLDPIVGKLADQTKKTADLKTAEEAAAAAKVKQTKAAKDLAAANDKVTLSVEQLAAAEIAKNLQASRVKQNVELKAIQGVPQINSTRLNPLAGDTAGAVTSFQGSVIKDNLLGEAAAVSELKSQYEEYAASVSNLVAPAIDQLFTAFEQGKNIFQALGDTIKSLVIDIVKAIVKATILKAITTAVSGGTGAGFFGGLFNALAGGLGGVAAPSFGGGASLSGGLALNGQVVFVQRGTDLVGVLNKGNSQINRVG